MTAPNILGGRRREPIRKTRVITNGLELQPPYEVVYTRARTDSNLMHAFARLDGGTDWRSCCGLTYAGIKRCDDALVVNCIKCALCKGCFACTEGHIREETMRLGKWETKDARRLYPFEMDSTHLMNAIAKLSRDKNKFKKDWKEWLECLNAEARLRHLL